MEEWQFDVMRKNFQDVGSKSQDVAAVMKEMAVRVQAFESDYKRILASQENPYVIEEMEL